MDIASLWNLQGQLFALLFVGALLRKANIFTSVSKEMLTDLVLYVTLPCSIILSFQIDIETSLAASLGVIFLISVGTQVFCFVLTKLAFRKVAPSQQSILHYGLLVSNAGFMGLPIAGELFGPAGLMYASIYLIPQRVVMWTAGLSIFSTAAASKREAMRKVLLHPCMIAVYIGVVLMVSRIPIPSFARMTLSSLGSCTTPLSMMLIGSLFAEMEKEHLHLDRNLLGFSFLRLVVIPLASLLVGRAIGIDPLVVGVGVILAAMPGGSSTVILASKYGRDTTYASKLVIVSTILSLISIPLWGMLL